MFCFWSTICPFCGSKLIVVMFFSKPYYYKGSFVFLRLEFFMGARRRPTRASGTRSKARQRGGRELVSHHGLDRLQLLVSAQGPGGGWAPPPTAQRAVLAPILSSHWACFRLSVRDRGCLQEPPPRSPSRRPPSRLLAPRRDLSQLPVSPCQHLIPGYPLGHEQSRNSSA